MKEMRVSKLVRGTPTETGDAVQFEVGTPDGPAMLTFDLGAAGILPVAALHGLTAAQKKRNGEGVFSFRLEDCRIVRDQASPAVLLAVKLRGAKAPLVFEVPDTALDTLEADIRQARKIKQKYAGANKA